MWTDRTGKRYQASFVTAGCLIVSASLLLKYTSIPTAAKFFAFYLSGYVSVLHTITRQSSDFFGSVGSRTRGRPRHLHGQTSSRARTTLSGRSSSAR